MSAWPTRRGNALGALGALGALVTLACAGVAAGCSSPGDRSHRFDDGWRLGTVAQTGTDLDATGWPSNDCRAGAAAAPASATPTRAFAAVWYLQMRHRQRRIVRLPSDLRVAVGDTVCVNLRDCAAPAVPAPAAAR